MNEYLTTWVTRLGGRLAAAILFSFPQHVFFFFLVFSALICGSIRNYEDEFVTYVLVLISFVDGVLDLGLGPLGERIEGNYEDEFVKYVLVSISIVDWVFDLGFGPLGERIDCILDLAVLKTVRLVIVSSLKVSFANSVAKESHKLCDKLIITVLVPTH